jgi:hypothetical protein
MHAGRERDEPRIVRLSNLFVDTADRWFPDAYVFVLAGVALALQLHFLSEVSAASVGLVSSPPERPCENTVDRDAPLGRLGGDATDFLDRPADQERCLVRRRRVFLSAGSALAR